LNNFVICFLLNFSREVTTQKINIHLDFEFQDFTGLHQNLSDSIGIHEFIGFRWISSDFTRNLSEFIGMGLHRNSWIHRTSSGIHLILSEFIELHRNSSDFIELLTGGNSSDYLLDFFFIFSKQNWVTIQENHNTKLGK